MELVTKAKYLLTTILSSISSLCIGQNMKSDTVCNLFTKINEKKKVDTIEFRAVYQGLTRGSDDEFLRELEKRKKLVFSEYVNKEYESTALDYSVTGCDKQFEGIISRKIDDQNYGVTNHDIGEYVNKVDVDALEPGQLIVLKCAVFNDADLMDNEGHYFYTVIGLKKVGQ
jgi:hypothetical protein